jgi:hypothetical protein
MAVMILMFFGLSCHVDWLVEASVSEKCTVSIFMAEALKMEMEFHMVT